MYVDGQWLYNNYMQKLNWVHPVQLNIDELNKSQQLTVCFMTSLNDLQDNMNI